MSATSPSTSCSLVGDVQRGDAAAWRRFAQIYVPLVYHWTRRAGMQASDAQDVVQNVFVAVMRGLPKFQQDAGGGLRAWLRVITRNAVIDWQRAKGRQVPALADDHPQWNALFAEEDGSSEALPPQDERQVVVLQAATILRTQMEASTWEMFWQVAVEGRSAEQVAAGMGVSPWAVYKAKARVLARFRNLVGEFAT